MVTVLLIRAKMVVAAILLISPPLVQRPFCSPHPRVNVLEQGLGKLGLEKQEEGDGRERIGIEVGIESITREDDV